MTGSTNEVTVVARPNSVPIVPARTAVIVVDMQNDFLTAGGMFERAGIDVSGVRAVIEPTGRVLEAAERADRDPAGLTLVACEAPARDRDRADVLAEYGAIGVDHLQVGELHHEDEHEAYDCEPDAPDRSVHARSDSTASRRAACSASSAASTALSSEMRKSRARITKFAISDDPP